MGDVLLIHLLGVHVCFTIVFPGQFIIMEYALGVLLSLSSWCVFLTVFAREFVLS